MDSPLKVLTVNGKGCRSSFRVDPIARRKIHTRLLCAQIRWAASDRWNLVSRTKYMVSGAKLAVRSE